MLNHRITRQEARSKTIDDFLSERKDDGRCNQLFKKFKKAWQGVRKDVNKQLQTDDKEMPNLNEKVLALNYCIIDENEKNTKYLYMVVKYLCSAQNEILDQVLKISESKDDHALSFLHVNSNYTTVQQVSLQAASKEDIISFQWHKELHSLPYAYNDLDYGMGEIVYYDIKRISVRLAESIAIGKRNLVFKLDRFIYSNEFFDTCGELLTEIQQLIPQDCCLPEEIEADPFIKQKPQNCLELLAHLEMLMFLLKRIPHVEREMPLLSFIEKWEKMLPSNFPKSSLPEPKQSIKLCHIVTLCEELENVLADGAIEGLPDNFRNEPLPDDLIKSLFDSLEIHNIPLHVFYKILRRFVFRYNSLPNFTPKKTLSDCLVNNSLWTSVEVMPGAEIYPNEITLEYVYTTLKLIKKKLKVRPLFLHDWSKNNFSQLFIS